MPKSDPIGYLASCHEADNRASSVLDLLHKDVQHRHFVTDTEVLLSGLQDGVAVPLDKGIAAQKAAATYKREKSLIYAAFLVVGTVSGQDGTERKLCAPVVYYPAKLEKADFSAEELIYLAVDHHEQNVNFSLFAELLGEDDGASDVLEKILARFPEPPFDEVSLSALMQIFRDFLPHTDVDAMYRNPKLVGERGVRKAQKDSRLTCLPSAMMALVSNPRATRGVMFELADAELRETFSTPTRVLFSDGGDAVSRGDDTAAPPVTSTVPAVLSRAQQKILTSARRNPLTLIVGPPGTGKSYTVAAVAVDHIMRGESVLIACRTDRALDVIEAKLMLGRTTTILRGGSRDYVRELKTYLRQLLSGHHDAGDHPTPTSLRRQLVRMMATIARDEKRLSERTALEHAWSELQTRRERLGTLARLRLAFLDWRVSRATPHWELHQRLERDQEERIRLASTLLRVTRQSQIAHVLAKHRGELKRFLGAIRARTSARQERLFNQTDLGVLLQAFPLWMSTFRDLYRLVPLERELFDLVIVDEATQSDMASPLPALHRARRAVVTGDPEQLRHVSFLARERQDLIADEHGLDDTLKTKLDYRDKSLLDLVDDALASQEQVAFLNEHFRSMPQIIEFSNREFYGGALQIMTARPDTLRARAVEIRNVSGLRAKNGVNAAEAEALIEELVKRIDSQQPLDASVCHSIGVLSPFRDQVDYLSKAILDRVELDTIEKHDLLIGTAYSFQGEERDVMLLSLAVDAQSHPMSFRYLSQPDVFNVSITRARDYQIVFTSFTGDDVSKHGLLARYLNQMARAPETTQFGGAHVKDAFLEAVMSRLRQEGFHLWPTYAVAGSTVDLVVEKEGRAFGIDTIGYSGELGAAIDLERYRMFARAGLSLFPLPWSAWERDAAVCYEAIERHWRNVAPLPSRK